MCSNAFVQAIALALSGGSAVGGFSDLYTPYMAASRRLATAVLQLDLSGYYRPVSVN
ncbi:hypothetical protein [Nostoc sp.]|uniref:hypothetical protein n=1 Tax=Nostoc sp. TaxID=1180 RepID=UPI002FF7E931